ncbi:MAG: hypothetical protein KA712_16370 [Myxococcales bacterium]|nr:hypothetical protein [Myxococcales bacterium]
MDTERRIGLTKEGTFAGQPAGSSAAEGHKRLRQLILLKLAALGHRLPPNGDDEHVMELGRDLFARYREQSRLLSEHLNPADRRIQDFLDRLLAPLGRPEHVHLAPGSFILDRWGLARELAFPMGKTLWENDYVTSYRTANGVIHNPVNDRRTTKGVFHVADVGLPVPADKIAVPLLAYARMLRAAFDAPASLKRVPFSAAWDEPVETMVSLLLRPLVCPEVPGRTPEKRMEIRFFVPGGLVSNLDFVESIFGNAGDPFLPENDAALDVDHWTGHTGCVILAPHLTQLKKRELGLPHERDASPRQKREGMFWRDGETGADELYNGGKPFKVTARDPSGVMVTILADNYFGYCKKEVKTQIGFAANLFGLAEEEHAGGALAFSSYNLGDKFTPDPRYYDGGHTFAEVQALLGDAITVHDTGYATDKAYPTIHYVPEDVQMDVTTQAARWTKGGEEQTLRLMPGHVYVHPSGYKVRLEKHPAAPSWRLVGAVAEGVFCHKPCTVSGGGKSEISKSILDSVLYGPIYVSDVEKDLELVDEIFKHSYAERWLPGRDPKRVSADGSSRPVLSPARSLGSVIKLLTPNEFDYTPEYNTWLRSIPNHVRALVYVIKRFYNASWGDDWRKRFTVDIVNGSWGHELKYDGRRLVGSYLRVGLSPDGAWRTFKLRQDFMPADKVQMEDDITASVVVPTEVLLDLPAFYKDHPSLKLAQNCEFRLFQRPDEAIHPGFDKQTEIDMSEAGVFASNFQPLDRAEVQEIVEDVALFDAFTKPMQDHLQSSLDAGQDYTLCSARPRIVDGKPSKNPRYLQVRPDVSRPRDRYLAEVSTRLVRRVPPDRAVSFPVTSVLSGRRNNPPEKGIRPLCVFNPIHYQELPELFMDYVCSVTGKSPSTTGAGSEGALTKGPFNAICATADLNNSLVSMLLTGYAGFSTAAGWVGPDFRFDHDISLLIPELWCRLTPAERNPAFLIAEGHLEKLEDFDHGGQKVLASRLGYRITSRFVRTYLGRVFDNPRAVFTDEILRPELQDPAVFADGVNNITEAQRRAALAYFEDGSIDDACPPLAAVLHLMAHGHYEGKDAAHPELRALFTREALLASDWYQRRLQIKQQRDASLWSRHVVNLRAFLAKPGHRDEADRLGIRARLVRAERELTRVSSPQYLEDLQGTIGADPIHEDRQEQLGETERLAAGA